MKISHRGPRDTGARTKRQVHSGRNKLAEKDARIERVVKDYLKGKLEAAEKKGEVVTVLTRDPGRTRVNIYGRQIDDSVLSYRLSTKSSNCGLHHPHWSHLESYRRGYLVRLNEFDNRADPDEWVALIGIVPTNPFDHEVISF